MNNIQKNFKRKGMVHGPAGKDKVHGVSLSAGEAVLPQQTVQKMGGAARIASLIRETTGKEPKHTLRSGAKYASGMVPSEISAARTRYGIPPASGDDLIKMAHMNNPQGVNPDQFGPVKPTPTLTASNPNPNPNPPHATGYPLPTSVQPMVQGPPTPTTKVSLQLHPAEVNARQARAAASTMTPIDVARMEAARRPSLVEDAMKSSTSQPQSTSSTPQPRQGGVKGFVERNIINPAQKIWNGTPSTAATEVTSPVTPKTPAEAFAEAQRAEQARIAAEAAKSAEKAAAAEMQTAATRGTRTASLEHAYGASGKQTADAMGAVGDAARWVKNKVGDVLKNPKTAPIIGTAVEGVMNRDVYLDQHKSDMPWTERAIQAIPAVAGYGMGTAAAVPGALGGAAAGSAVPVVGTVAGGVVGGLAGGTAGYVAGSSTAEAAMKKLSGSENFMLPHDLYAREAADDARLKQALAQRAVRTTAAAPTAAAPTAINQAEIDGWKKHIAAGGTPPFAPTPAWNEAYKQSIGTFNPGAVMDAAAPAPAAPAPAAPTQQNGLVVTRGPNGERVITGVGENAFAPTKTTPTLANAVGGNGPGSGNNTTGTVWKNGQITTNNVTPTKVGEKETPNDTFNRLQADVVNAARNGNLDEQRAANRAMKSHLLHDQTMANREHSQGQLKIAQVQKEIALGQRQHEKDKETVDRINKLFDDRYFDEYKTKDGELKRTPNKEKTNAFRRFFDSAIPAMEAQVGVPFAQWSPTRQAQEVDRMQMLYEVAEAAGKVGGVQVPITSEAGIGAGNPSLADAMSPAKGTPTLANKLFGWKVSGGNDWVKVGDNVVREHQLTTDDMGVNSERKRFIRDAIAKSQEQMRK